MKTSSRYTIEEEDSDNSSCSSSSYDSPGSLTVNDNTKRVKASARERRRRHVLNDALDSLRKKVSIKPRENHKLSKIEVLRNAIDYIALLSYHLDYSATPSYNPPLYDVIPHFGQLNHKFLGQERRRAQVCITNDSIEDVSHCSFWNQETNNHKSVQYYHNNVPSQYIYKHGY